MNQREKLLALIAGSLVALIGVMFISYKIWSAFASRSRQLTALKVQIDQDELAKQSGWAARQEIEKIAAQALPISREDARSLYQDWLLRLVSVEAGLSNASVKPVSTRQQGDVFDVHRFSVTGMGNLEQVTDLLYDLSAAPLAHRVQYLSLRPIPNKKEITVALTLEAIAMSQAPSRSELSYLPDTKLAGLGRKHYQEQVLGRNLFGPANRPPALKVEESYVAFAGRPFTLQAEATDPDPLDKVAWEADVSELPNARFSAAAGKVDWMPRRNGDYWVTIAALDDGFPRQRVEKEVKITVKDPPPSGPPRVNRPSLAAAKFAFVTGVTRAGGRPEVWITLRTENKTLRLTAGETFKLGEVVASVAAIHDDQRVEIEAAGQRVTARLGKNLADAGLE